MNLSKYMTNQKSTVSVESQPVDTTGFILHGLASHESHLEYVKERLPGREISFEAIDTASMETQQLQVAQRQAMIEGVKNQLAEYADKHPATGPVHIYLLDGKALASGDPDAQATLNALASSALADPKRTVAALLPEDPASQDAPESNPATDAINDVVQSYLTDSGAASVESLDAVLARFQTKA